MLKLLILILIFINVPILSAFSDFQRERIEATDDIEVETKEFCFYEKKVVEYKPKDDFDFAYYDLDDYKIEYGAWQTEKDFSGAHEEKTNYYYEDIKEIRYIHLLNTISPDDKSMVNRIIIAHHDQKLDYEVTCYNCPNDLAHLVQNETASFEGFYLTEESELVLDLGDYYELENLTFNMFVANYEHGANRFEINTSRTKENVFTSVIWWSWFSDNEGEFRWFQYHLLDDATVKEPDYYEKVAIDELGESTKTRNYFAQTYYREKIYLYKNYEWQAIETEKENSDYCLLKYRYRELEEKETSEEVMDVNEETESHEEKFFEKEANKIPADKKSEQLDEQKDNEVDEKEKDADEKNASKEKLPDETETSDEKENLIAFNSYMVGVGCLLLLFGIIRRYVKN